MWPYSFSLSNYEKLLVFWILGTFSQRLQEVSRCHLLFLSYYQSASFPAVAFSSTTVIPPLLPHPPTLALTSYHLHPSCRQSRMPTAVKHRHQPNDQLLEKVKRWHSKKCQNCSLTRVLPSLLSDWMLAVCGVQGSHSDGEAIGALTDAMATRRVLIGH